MIEDRKKIEIEHYDKMAREWREKIANSKEQIAKYDIELINVMKMSSYQFVYELLEKYVPGKKVLDYGCGHGMHAISIAKMAAKEVIGIDLSEESLKIAEQRANRELLNDRVKFIKMDAEKLELPDNFFDIVFDGGAFSSIDINKAFSETKRVLKPGGCLIGIETLGHNPLTNFKRWLNKKGGRRTEWAASHIMKIKDFKLARQYFKTIDVHFFHLTSIIAMPFQNMPAGATLVKIFEGIDKLLLKLPFIKRFAFKAVFIFCRDND